MYLDNYQYDWKIVNKSLKLRKVKEARLISWLKFPGSILCLGVVLGISPLSDQLELANLTQSIQWKLCHWGSLFTDPLFSLWSPSNALDKIKKPRGISWPPAQGDRGGRRGNALVLAHSSMFSKRTKRKIKQRLCTGYHWGRLLKSIIRWWSWPLSTGLPGIAKMTL